MYDGDTENDQNGFNDGHHEHALLPIAFMLFRKATFDIVPFFEVFQSLDLFDVAF